MIIPDADEEVAGLLAGELLAALGEEGEGPTVRTASAAWRPGDDGEAVISRARASPNGSTAIPRSR